MGLRHDDLKNTIDPLVSIDEFEPKTGSQEEVIVVAFYTIDEAPGKDLDDFIEKSTIPFLDAEVSTNPDPTGKFLVFVEMERNEEFFDNFDALIKDVSNISGELVWRVRPYLADRAFNYLNDEWKDYVIVLPDEYVSKSDFSLDDKADEPEETLESYFKDSLLLTMTENDAIIVLANAKSKVVLERIGFGPVDQVFECQDLQEAALNLLDRSGRIADINKILGYGWTAIPINEYVVISNDWSNNILLTRMVE